MEAYIKQAICYHPSRETGQCFTAKQVLWLPCADRGADASGLGGAG